MLSQVTLWYDLLKYFQFAWTPAGFMISAFGLDCYIVNFLLTQIKSSDTSTAESGSEAEDIASPKAMSNYSQLPLIPVREEVGSRLSLHNDYISLF